MNHVSTTARTRRMLLAALLGAALVAAFARTALSSSGAVVTSGTFHEFASGAGMDISGRAQMVRTAEGRTIVAIQVRGLNPNTTYASHVHAATCGVGDADGHFKFDPAGPPAPPNEIWPGPFSTNPAGIGNGFTIAEREIIGYDGPALLMVFKSRDP